MRGSILLEPFFVLGYIEIGFPILKVLKKVYWKSLAQTK